MNQVLVGRKAPTFQATAVMPNDEIKQFNFPEDTKNQYTLLVFYPLDFTFVCPSELIAIDRRITDFEKRNTKLLGISIDSQFAHLAWRNTSTDKGGIGKIRFPLIADVTRSIADSYGVLHPEAGVAFRGTFLIDRSGIVRSQVVNDLPIGRNVDELLRLVDALQFHEENGEVCPANWHAGKQGMKASTEGVQQYLSKHIDEL